MRKMFAIQNKNNIDYPPYVYISFNNYLYGINYNYVYKAGTDGIWIGELKHFYDYSFFSKNKATGNYINKSPLFKILVKVQFINYSKFYI